MTNKEEIAALKTRIEALESALQERDRISIVRQNVDLDRRRGESSGNGLVGSAMHAW